MQPTTASGSDPRRHLINRGSTRPPTFWGVPVLAFVLTAIAFAIPGFWLLPFQPRIAFGFWLVFVPVIAGMRLASRRDPYTLTQYGQRLLRRVRNRNRRRWGALSYSPLRALR